MKNFLLLLVFFPLFVMGEDVKISQLPLGIGANTTLTDSFPYVSTQTGVTKRLTLFDIANVPAIVSRYAPKASPVFTGTVTAPNFVGSFSGSIVGNAATATALAANPTDCSAGFFATTIDALGNLTCAQPALTNLIATTASRALVTNGSGFITPATTTAAEIGYVNGVTSAIQTQIDTKAPISTTVTLTGTQTLTNKTITAPLGIVKGDVGLGNVDNTSDATKNSAVATLTNKSIDATTNTITNIADAQVKTAAAISLNKLAATTGSKALVSDASGFVSASTVTATELGYLSGATSSVQTQITALKPMTTAGDMIVGGASGVSTRLPVGSNGYLLSVVSGAPAWSPAPVALPLGGTTGQFLVKNSATNGDASWQTVSGGLLTTSTVVATNAASLPFTGASSRTMYLLAPTSVQDFTGVTKQVADGVTAGQELWLIGTSDTNYVVFNSAGTNMKLNGDWYGGADKLLKIVWTGTKWLESGRNN